MTKLKKQKNTKTEFSKKVVIWSAVFVTVCTAASYVLAAFGHDTVSDVTIAVITECIAIVVGYLAKSYGEKNSRNKYNVTIDDEDEDG